MDESGVRQEPVVEQQTWWVRRVGESSKWHPISVVDKPLIGSIVRPSCCDVTFVVAAVAPTAQGGFCSGTGRNG